MSINKNNIGFVIRLIGVLIVTIHIFSLVGAAQTSTLEVISDPGGANVYVDDVYKGQTNSDGSPFYIPNIPYGSHIIRVGKSGCNEWSQTYQISAPTTSVLAPLTCPSLLRTFIINSIPDGGGIYIDNNFRGFTPKTISDVPYGSHTVKIVKSGYYDWVQNWLAGDSPQTITAYLVPLPDTILPTISISSPYNGQSFTTNTITVSGTASDNIGLSKVEVKVGSGSWQLASGTTSWSNQVTLTSGSNTIYAKATDTSGNTNEASVAVTYNPSTPTPTAQCPPAGTYLVCKYIDQNGYIEMYSLNVNKYVEKIEIAGEVKTQWSSDGFGFRIEADGQEIISRRGTGAFTLSESVLVSKQVGVLRVYGYTEGYAPKNDKGIPHGGWVTSTHVLTKLAVSTTSTPPPTPTIKTHLIFINSEPIGAEVYSFVIG